MSSNGPHLVGSMYSNLFNCLSPSLGFTFLCVGLSFLVQAPAALSDLTWKCFCFPVDPAEDPALCFIILGLTFINLKIHWIRSSLNQSPWPKGRWGHMVKYPAWRARVGWEGKREHGHSWSTQAEKGKGSHLGENRAALRRRQGHWCWADGIKYRHHSALPCPTLS